MARRRTGAQAALGPASLAMAALGLWIAELITARRTESRTSLRAWLIANREAPSGLCLVAGITWFVSMAVPTVAAVFLFAALEAAGVDLRWWGWVPPLFLTAAVSGLAVNGLRSLTNDEAIPTLAADALSGCSFLPRR